ncbi:hypothetical protein BH09BAC1_BH09BAC1_06510 [soil metagenome]
MVIVLIISILRLLVKYLLIINQIKRLAMSTNKNSKQQGNLSNSKSKTEPQWYPGDSGGAVENPDRKQKINKAPFKNPNDTEDK